MFGIGNTFSIYNQPQRRLVISGDRTTELGQQSSGIYNTGLSN
jgi:hypothetical protein